MKNKLTPLEQKALIMGLKAIRKYLYHKFEKELTDTQDEDCYRKTRKQLINDLTDINTEIHEINEIIYFYELPSEAEKAANEI